MESSGPRRLFVTRVLKQFDCDTFIPDINMDKYKLLPQWVLIQLFVCLHEGLCEESLALQFLKAAALKWQ